jgi:UTP--glucose-1-phosphate uridylyltransferase
MIFITGRHKRSIEDHFDRAPELEAELAAKGKNDLLDIVRNISPEADSFVYIRQPEPLGLGHAVLCAEPVVGDEPFAVILADDLIDAERPVIGQLCDARAARGGGSVLAVETARADTGQVRHRRRADRCEVRASRTSSEAGPEKAIDARVLGRCCSRTRGVRAPEDDPRGAGGEIQLTDAIARMLGRGDTYAYRYEGRRFDCGSKEGFLAATLHYARKAGYLG